MEDTAAKGATVLGAVGLGLIALGLALILSQLPGLSRPQADPPRSFVTLGAISPPVAEQAAEPSGREYSLLACGDILLARDPGKRAAAEGYRYPFQGIRELVSEADVAFANLETPASYLGEPWPGKPPVVTFRADPATLFGLAWAGFDAVSLANNHMNDYGPRAVAETLDYLDALGVARTGAGLSLEEARSPAIVRRDGAVFAFLAYAEPIWSVRAARPVAGIAAVTRAETAAHGAPPATVPTDPDAGPSSPAGVAHAFAADMAEDVARVRAAMNPDYLFVSVHWGDEHQHYPTKAQRAFGRAAIDAGATAVLGHHPHVLQGVERYGAGLIIYSMGNFVFDMEADGTYRSAAFRLILSGGVLAGAEVLPIRIGRASYAPELASAGDAEGILADLKRWSAALGTELLVSDGIGRVDFPPLVVESRR